MSELKRWLRQLEACVQEELGAQGRVLERLEGQGAALASGEPAAIEAATRRLDGELTALAARSERRGALVRRLAASWGVEARVLTLSSIAERAGDEGRRLGRMRTELRQAAARTARQTRRNALHARLHQRAWNEILAGVLDAAGGAAGVSGGRLVDAEA